MKKTRLSSVASLLAAGVLMGGCMADFGGERDSEAGATQVNGVLDPCVAETCEPVGGIGRTAPSALGSRHSMAIKSDGTVWTWGNNSSGQLGDGTTVSRRTPTQVSGLTGVAAVEASTGDFSLALKSDGTLWAWGRNDFSQLGNGTSTGSSTPVQVSDLTDVVAVAANSYHSVAVKSDGTVWAWGYNATGQLGDGTTVSRRTPTQVSSLTGVVAVATNGYSSLAVKSDGTVWGWGYGHGYTPTQLSNLEGIVAVAVGADHSLALKNDGTVWAWGNNYLGQLGNGTSTNSSTPVQVSDLTGVVAVTAGSNNSLAVTSDGTAWVWGDNSYGQLGDGTTTFRPKPVPVIGLPMKL